MQKIILTIILIIFSAHASHASAWVSNCPEAKKTENAIEKDMPIPCHANSGEAKGNHTQSQSDISESKVSSCLCIIKCLSNIVFINPHGRINEFSSLDKLNLVWKNETISSISLIPDTPPPKS